MDVQTEFVNLTVNDGSSHDSKSMRAYIAKPSTAGANAPGLIVMQEAFGVNGHIRDVTERFAREGYLAIAPELFHRSAAPGTEISYNDFPKAMEHLQKLSEAGMAADARAAYDWLRANGVGSSGAVATVGFCMGGRAAFLASATLPLNCAVSFYGGGIAPNQQGAGLLGRVPDLRSPVLFFWGGRDKHIGPEQMRMVTEALRKENKPFVNVEFSEADHAFFCDARPSYSPEAAAQAWPMTLAFLKTYTSAREQSVRA